ncbi:MAG: cation:proton antiporter [Treponema sp.]|nr:cation:proton antiporter [Treponema sp.]
MDTHSINETMAVLALQLGIILFAVRFFGKLALRFGIPQVLGELSAGIIVGPYALGSIPLPGFPQGIFGLSNLAASSLPVSTELYAIATIASVILLFMSGLETDIGLFIRYSAAGTLIGLGGAALSFLTGNLVGVFLLDTSFMDPRCLFLGILSMATSLGITARILSEQKKLNSPEGVTTMAAAVFDDVLGIIALAVLMGIVAVLSLEGPADGGINLEAILLIAGKAIIIWLSFTLLGFVFSKRLALFLKFFKSSFDFSILALGVALLLAGIFEMQGLAMIIGACIAGLSLSRTDIAPVIQERMQGIEEFFVPIFFAVMGMMVNVRDIINPYVLTFGAIYLGTAFLSKVVGCGLPAMLMGFNVKGALRIGVGMVPRGEVALILAGIGIATGILNQQLFSVAVLMTLATTLVAPPLLGAVLKLPGQGTKKPVKDDNHSSSFWHFRTEEIANMVINRLLRDLRGEGFYIQTMYMDIGISQARKDDIIFIIHRDDTNITIETERNNEHFIKTLVYEVIVELYGVIQELKENSESDELRRELLDGDSPTREKLYTYMDPECISLDLQGETKEEIILEMVNLLSAKHRSFNKDWVIRDVMERERIMSTGMQYGIALPHGRSDGVDRIVIAVGIKKEGVPFEAIDNELSRFFILTVCPRKESEPYIQLLTDIGSILHFEEARTALLKAESPEEVIAVFRPQEKA